MKIVKNINKFDLIVHKKELVRFICDFPTGVSVEGEKSGLRYMVNASDLRELSDIEQERYEQGQPLGCVIVKDDYDITCRSCGGGMDCNGCVNYCHTFLQVAP